MRRPDGESVGAGHADPRRKGRQGSHVDPAATGDAARGLDQQHVALLAARAITLAVALRCGLFTERIKRRLRDDGFSEAQARRPSLAIPIYDPAGTRCYLQIRPDAPRRSNDGKPIKYEIPSKAVSTIYVPPIVSRDDLHDLSKTLFLCESPLKAIALAAVGAGAVVATLGISSGRTGSRGRDRGALAAWDDIPLRNREVVLVPDSDLTRNPHVHGDVCKLAEALERRGAVVKYIVLPHADDGKTMGVDDFLATGKTLADVFDLERDKLPGPPREAEDADAPVYPYLEHNGATYYLKRTDAGAVPVQLANFTARIISQAQLDDGAERWVTFEMAAKHAGRRVTFSLTAVRFDPLAWVTDQLGGEAIITPGQATAGHLRAAIKHLSTPIPTRQAYAHTGWRQIGGVWVYLHGAGALGPVGPVAGVDCELDGLPHYALPAPPTGGELRDAVRSSLALLDLAPLRVTVPVVGATYRAPLGDVDCSIQLTGRTGTFKSELAARAEQHFGPAMDKDHLPGSWESTENALEARAFVLKDSLFVIDDFVPRGSPLEQQRIHARAARVLRAQGNHSGRQRMRADGTLRPDRPPRGLILSTGEDLPRGESVRARMLHVEVAPGDVDVTKLTQAQATGAEGVYAAAMAGFVQWLAPRLEAVRARQVEIVRLLRTAAHRSDAHRRTATIVAEIATGIGWALRYAVDVGAMATDAAEQRFADAWVALGEQAAAQVAISEASDPVRRYLELVGAAISSGRAHLADADNGAAPTNAEARGWLRDGEGAWHGRGRCIGWVRSRGEELTFLLEPDAALAEVAALAVAQGEAFVLGREMIAKRLFETGYVARIEEREDGSKRYHARDTVPARGRNRASFLALRSLSPNETGPTGPKAEKAAPTMAISWSGLFSIPDHAPDHRTTNPDRGPEDGSGPVANRTAARSPGPGKTRAPQGFSPNRSGWSGSYTQHAAELKRDVDDELEAALAGGGR